jgi:hypothetical protein
MYVDFIIIMSMNCNYFFIICVGTYDSLFVYIDMYIYDLSYGWVTTAMLPLPTLLPAIPIAL